MQARVTPSRLVRTLAVAAALVAAPWMVGDGQAAVQVRNPDGVAVIIGNRDYHHVGEVKYAHRDAEAFRGYVLDVLGFDAENLIDLRDATQAEMVGVFGTAQDHEGQLAFWIDPEGGSDVVVFYSGHGMPGLDEDDLGAYLLPANANPNKPELNGYSIDVLNRNLGKLPARSVAVYVDACFSGFGGDGEALLKASMVLPEAALPEGVAPNTTVFTATTGKQLAYWDDEAEHGMFTHHLLNALYGGADADGDGQVTVAETERHLARHLRRAVRRTYHREQSAALRDGSGTGATVLALASADGTFPARPVLGKGDEEVAGGTDDSATPISDALAALRSVQSADMEGLRAALWAGADVNARDKGGMTALTIAANEGYVLMVPVLLEAGADPDLRAVDGATALFLAARNGHVEVVEQLLQAGADVSIAGPKGNTASEEARARRHMKVVQAFEAVRKAEEETKQAEARAAERARQQGEAERREREQAEGERRAETAQAAEEALGLTRTQRVRVQVGLATLGHDVGSPDGVFGRRTRAGIEAYQYRQGLPETGYLTGEQAETLVALGEEAQAEAERLTEEARRKAEEEERARRAEQRRKAEEEERRRAEAKKRKVGQVFRDCPKCPELVVVPAGSYRMGSPPDEEGRNDSEGPMHRVTISNPIAVGLHEVTRGEYRRFVEETGYAEGGACLTVEKGDVKGDSKRGWRNPGYAQSDGHPVVCVSWEDAQAYTRWLSRKTAKRYRLLSESEWEYAARAGTSTAAHWGDDPSDACTNENSLDAVTMFRVFQKLNEHFGSMQWMSDLGSERWQRWVSKQDAALQTALGAVFFFLEPKDALLVSLDLYYQRNPARRPKQNLPSTKHLGMEEFLSVTKGSLCRDGYADTSPVGSFSANGYGLHDMLGNVSEWTLDCWHDSYRGAPRDGSAWESAGFELDAAGNMRPSRESGGCDWRVFRGGSWGFFGLASPGSLGMRSASRGGFPADVRSIYLGFRVVRTFTP